MIISIVVLFATSISTNAQYNVNKIQYDFKQYVPEAGDPYNPRAAGIASFFVPGLGQMLIKEAWRGAGFLGGSVGCWVLYVAGASSMAIDIAIDGNNDGSGAGLMLLGLGGAITLSIWSIVDATRVAKVNNMAWRDSNTSSLLNIQPALRLTPEGKAAPGMALSYNF